MISETGELQRWAVVGGTSGIGLAVLNKLTELGDDVVQLSRKPELAPDNARVISRHWDVTSEDFPRDALPDCLDGLIYCPGSITLKPVNRLQEKDFRQDLEVNLFGAVKAIQGSLPSLKRAETASIVLFSTVAVQTGMAYHASIASAKGAVEGLVRALAAELAPTIRINALALSITDTPLAERLLGSGEKRKLAADRHPLKRVGSPEDIAASVVWLLRDPWVTGQVIAVDGGLSSVRLF